MCKRGSHSLLEYSRIDGIAIDWLVRHLAFVDVMRHFANCVVE